MTKKTIFVGNHDVDLYSFHIKTVEEAVDILKNEFGHMNGFFDYYGFSGMVFCETRLETDEEYKTRMEAELKAEEKRIAKSQKAKETKEKNRLKKEQEERKLYESLKAKYEK